MIVKACVAQVGAVPFDVPASVSRAYPAGRIDCPLPGNWKFACKRPLLAASEHTLIGRSVPEVASWPPRERSLKMR